MAPKSIIQGKTALKIAVAALGIILYAETLPQTISTLETTIKAMTGFIVALYILIVSCIYLDTRQARAANDAQAMARNRRTFLSLTAMPGGVLRLNLLLLWLR